VSKLPFCWEIRSAGPLNTLPAAVLATIIVGVKLMSQDSSQASRIDLQALTIDNFRPYGWLLGKTIQLDGSIPAFSSRETDFWQEHIFNPGIGGETEVLWVNYKDTSREVSRLEVHRLTQQAVIPLTGEIIQVVAASEPDGSPDIGSICAFRLRVGEGICMQAGCWHTTRVDAHEVKCLMLTRRSTTIDLVAHLAGGSPLSESAISVIDKKVLAESIGD
jgi:ureidoglycolate lyase